MSFLDGKLLEWAKEAANAAVLMEGKRRLVLRLLSHRNAQLARMIQHIVSFVFYMEQDNIDQNSTSVTSIW